jgi:hypothetical protein
LRIVNFITYKDWNPFKQLRSKQQQSQLLLDALFAKLLKVLETSVAPLLIPEAAELAVSIAGQGQIQVNDRDNNFPSRGQLNTIRARSDFNFNPQTDIEQGFQEYYDWFTNPFYRTKKAV